MRSREYMLLENLEGATRYAGRVYRDNRNALAQTRRLMEHILSPGDYTEQFVVDELSQIIEALEAGE